MNTMKLTGNRTARLYINGNYGTIVVFDRNGDILETRTTGPDMAGMRRVAAGL